MRNSNASGRDERVGNVIGRRAVGGGSPTEFASGFSSPLGVVANRRGTLFVSDSEATRRGPFGRRPYGRVWKVTDTDHDGVADTKRIVLKDLPNGRHNTNGLALGPHKTLYITNGNSTDDGVEGGPPEVRPWSGSVIRVKRKAKGRSVADLRRHRALVAHGMRNIFDLTFSPLDPTKLFIPMNGADDAREGSTGDQPGQLEDSDDLLYRTDIDDQAVADFGFPSCLYNRERRGNLRPYDSPNKKVIDKFWQVPEEIGATSSHQLRTSSLRRRPRLPEDERVGAGVRQRPVRCRVRQLLRR